MLSLMVHTRALRYTSSRFITSFQKFHFSLVQRAADDELASETEVPINPKAQWTGGVEGE
jgi:hypothetical protein